MNFKNRILLLLLLLPIFIYAESPDHADLILRHGHIYTMNPGNPWAQTIAILNQRIVYIGKDSDAQKWIGPQTKVIELQDRFVMPSFIDSHVHPASSGIQLNQLYLGDMKTKEEILAAVKKYAEENKTATWILGSRWQLPVFPNANPKKEWLDEIVTDRPVSLSSGDGHSTWVNSKAIEIAGVTKDTPDPENGRIERNENGEPSGTFRESASRLIRKFVPEPTAEEQFSGLKKAIETMNRLGITGFQDASVRQETLETYQKADSEGILTARVHGAQYADPALPMDQIDQFVKFREQYHGKHFDAASVKIFADGVIEANTAALLKPYLDEKKDLGIYNWKPEIMNAFVQRLDQEKFQIHFHAIGDGAIREALDALELARKKNGPRDARPLLAHIELIDPADIPRFHSVPAIACFQPLWAYADSYINDLTIPKLGAERSRWLYPMGSVAQKKGWIAFGSDWSVSSVNPLDGIEVAVTRCDPDADSCKESFLPMEKLDLPTALHAYTLGSAYANFWEKETGSLEAGKSADLIVLSKDLFKIPAAEINQAKVLMTLFEGKVIFKSEDWK